MASQIQGSTTEGVTVPRCDRSLLALLEAGAACLLIVSTLMPWYLVPYMTAAGVPSTTEFSPHPFPGGSAGALVTADLLIPFATLAVLAFVLAGLVMPGRGEVVAILVAFLMASAGAMMRINDVLNVDHSGFFAVPVVGGTGLWLFTGAAASGAVLSVIDLLRGGSSTIFWRALRKPSTRHYGPFVLYACVVALALPVALFPMFPRWWLLVWCLLLAGLIWSAIGLRRKAS
jgi:hypothetical protein